MTARIHRSSRELSFEIVKQLQSNGQFRSTLNVTCAKCHRLEKVPWTTAPVPEFIKNKMVARGWTFDAHKKSACVCPECNRKGVGVRGPLPAELGDALAPPTSTSSEALLTTRIGREQPHSSDIDANEVLKQPDGGTMRQPTPEAEGPLGRAALPRTLTVDERLKVRQLLDSNFDDAAGYYISGYSDQRIGTEVNVPWAAVAQIREAAYGPLREDERLTALRTDFATAKAEYHKFDATMKVEINKLNAALRDLGVRLTTIENKLKELSHD